jgi:hypothetical protein
MELIEKIKSEIAAFDEKRKQLCEELQKQFPDLFKDFFAKHEWVEKFQWRQYTPYFNDGDECVFGVSNDYSSLEINGVDYYDDSVYGIEDKKAVYAELSDILQSVPDEFYKDLFGDHMEITVNRDGTIEKEEYEHD